MHLTRNFTLEELTHSDTAVRLGIDNTPGQIARDNLLTLANGLELVRYALGSRPIRINSGFRCEELNKKIGGSAKSAHMSGLAADFVCPEFGTPRQIAEHLAAIAHTIMFDQLIEEGTWVHIAFPEFDAKPRKQVLTAKFTNGKATYTQGLV